MAESDVYDRFAETIVGALDNPVMPGADTIVTESKKETEKETKKEEYALFNQTIVEIFYGDE